MALFICPACERHSDILAADNRSIVPHTCPHCGQEFKVDKDLNLIIEE